MRRLIDVSHTVEHGMITYKGLPAPVICDWMSREASRSRYAPASFALDDQAIDGVVLDLSGRPRWRISARISHHGPQRVLLDQERATCIDPAIAVRMDGTIDGDSRK